MSAHRGFQRVLAYGLALAALVSAPAHAAVLSYPIAAIDEVGVTGAATEAIGVPNYRFVNDAGLGFGGTSTEVFDVGESTVLVFPNPLRDIPTQHDLIVYAFVGGLGATDDATVLVEASTDGSTYTPVAQFDTSEARDRDQDFFENDFEAVKKFFVEFGGLDGVTHVRLTNLAGTSEGLRLDALEGLHPTVSAQHGFELRLHRSREDSWQHFRIQVRNVGDPGGVPIREIRVNNTSDPTTRLELTAIPIESVDGDFICVENCLEICTQPPCTPPPPRIPFSRHVWSIDGTTEAPPGTGLAPGRAASHPSTFGMDTDSDFPYLSGYSFEITFTDGTVVFVDYDADVVKEIGSLYEKYSYFDPMPLLSWNRPVDYYEFVPEPGLAIGLLAGAGALALVGRRRRA